MGDQKERYYSDAEIVREYEQRRFARGGGRYVAEVETATLRVLLGELQLDAGDVALDCPAGTGRFLPLFRELRLEPIAIDISPAMLATANRVEGARCLRASADALPFKSGSVKVWLMSRFAFHFADLRAFFREAGRVLAEDGVLVFDIYHWTPRQWIPGRQSFIGGRVHTHRLTQVKEWLREAGLEITRQKPTFLLAPYLYGFMPAFLPRFLDRTSDALAPRWKTKSYLVARKLQ